jgi:sulfate transport system ATP-binding protein
MLEIDGQVYVRPHDIELVPHAPGASGVVAVLRYIHAAGPTARLTLEQVQTREMIEVEMARVTLAGLDLRVGDLVNLRLRQSRTFDEDYSI